MSALAIAAAVWWGAALVLLVGSALAAALQPRIRRTAPGRGAAPPVSVVVPLKEDSAGLGAATASLGRLATPVAEILLCTAQTPSAALGTASEALAEIDGAQVRVISSNAARTGNPKVANIAEGIRQAASEHILLKDAETVLSPGVLGEMIDRLGEGVGLVVAVPIGRGAAGFAGEVDAAFMNGYGARMILAASTMGLGVGIGAAMLFRRSDLTRADGLAAMASAIGDDHALSRAMARIGLATACCEAPVFQHIGHRRFEAVCSRHQRWSICRRTEAPVAFFAEPLSFAMAGAAAAGLAGPLFGAGWVAPILSTLALWIVVEMALSAVKEWPAGMLSPLALIARETLLPLLWVGALAARTIRWGERDVPVDGLKRPSGGRS